MKYYILLLGLCLLGCNSQPSKQDKSIQPVIQKDDKFTNHYELPLTELEEREVLHYADSVLQVKGIKLVDYRNEIYQYGDIRFYWNKKFNYIRGNTKSKTNYTYDIDIQQIKEDRKKYEKSQCFPFASHFGLKRG